MARRKSVEAAAQEAEAPAAEVEQEAAAQEAEAPAAEVEQEAAAPDLRQPVTVRNVSQELVLVGEKYMLPGEVRTAPGWQVPSDDKRLLPVQETE